MRTVTVRSDREVDALVREVVFDRPLPTREQMVECAEAWWSKYGSGTVYFNDLGGFQAWTETDGSVVAEARFPAYTSDPVACSALKKKLREQGWLVAVEWYSDMVLASTWNDDETNDTESDTEERAVALAALRAHGIDVTYQEEG